MCNKDKELLKRALEGDISAFEELVGRNQKKIYNLCYRMMGNAEDAQDMSQEAFIKAFKNLKKFKLKCAFSTWMYRIAVNTCLDELRRRKNNKLSIDEINESGIMIEDKKIGDIAENIACRNDIISALNKLQDKEKTIIILKDVQGNSYEDIAAILQCPVGTVRSRLNRARKKLAGICIEMELYPASYRHNECKEAK